MGKGSQTVTFTSTAPTGVTIGSTPYTPTGHRHLGPDRGLHHRRLVDQRVHHLGRGGQLHRCRHLCHRRQPGRRRQLHGGAPGAAVGVGGPGGAVHLLHLDGPDHRGGRRRHLLALGLGHLGSGGCLHHRCLGRARCASISGGVVSFQTAGTCTLDANQAGNATYAPAAQVQQVFSVGAGPQTVSFTSTAPTTAVAGGATYTPTASATSGLIGDADRRCLHLERVLHQRRGGQLRGGGQLHPRRQPGRRRRLHGRPAGPADLHRRQGFPDGQLHLDRPDHRGGRRGTYSPTASATSGLAVTVTVDASSSSVCAITAGAVSFSAAGTCTLDANQSGSANYNPAPQVQQVFTVGKGIPDGQLHLDGSHRCHVNGPTYTVAATATSGLAVYLHHRCLVRPRSARSPSDVVSFIGAGSCVIDANQAGNANYLAAPQVQQTVSVSATAPGPRSSGPPPPATGTPRSPGPHRRPTGRASPRTP